MLCIIKSKHKELIEKKIFPIWISIFAFRKKFLLDNKSEFNNYKLITPCENVNIHICTNAFVEWYNDILGYTVAKTIDDVKYDFELALVWVAAAKHSFKNFNGFSPNQIVFGKI